ncbi:Hypothetical_protein [Hexamita inflata]|uniref:Hypothetical_protein n=1 Tax=Hexamita inflata TaxID=28002 RepID=A0AA86REE2_9EUKA|nr:Hypothetical protein HINF_LOCUS60206 [Hexamita inflata]
MHLFSACISTNSSVKNYTKIDKRAANIGFQRGKFVTLQSFCLIQFDNLYSCNTSGSQRSRLQKCLANATQSNGCEFGRFRYFFKEQQFRRYSYKWLSNFILVEDIQEEYEINANIPTRAFEYVINIIELMKRLSLQQML